MTPKPFKLTLLQRLAVESIHIERRGRWDNYLEILHWRSLSFRMVERCAVGLHPVRPRRCPWFPVPDWAIRLFPALRRFRRWRWKLLRWHFRHLGQLGLTFFVEQLFQNQQAILRRVPRFRCYFVSHFHRHCRWLWRVGAGRWIDRSHRVQPK